MAIQLTPEIPSIAIVGIGGIFPEAPNLEAYWKNIVEGKSAAKPVPEERWPVKPESVFNPIPGKPDKVYSYNSCFIEKIPPVSAIKELSDEIRNLEGLDPLFHLLLNAGVTAFADSVTEPVDKNRIGVIIGNLALPTEKSSMLAREILGSTFEEKLLGHSETKRVTNPLNRYVAGLPAGILANGLGLGGGCCTLDA
ncbi:MAG: hypothetical protein FWD70_02260, partial [Desulfuromonadales bacterium]|nr:hypothetical protein [Desulfuromonadales bacterium]